MNSVKPQFTDYLFNLYIYNFKIEKEAKIGLNTKLKQIRSYF